MKQARASVSFSVELISWLLSVHMALFFLDQNPRKERAAITGGLCSLATLTTPLMAVMQLTRLLSVRARGGHVQFNNLGVKTKPFVRDGSECGLDSQVSGEEGAFRIKCHADESDRVRRGAALLGQLSLACHLSVRSALLVIYLPCTAAGPVTCHSFPTVACSAKASHFLHPLSHKTLHTQKCVQLNKLCIVLL